MAAASSEDHHTGPVRGSESVRASLREVSVQGDGEEAGEEVCLQAEEFLFEVGGGGGGAAGVCDMFVGVCGGGGGEGAGEVPARVPCRLCGEMAAAWGRARELSALPESGDGAGGGRRRVVERREGRMAVLRGRLGSSLALRTAQDLRCHLLEHFLI
ncbi:PREDICTED: POU domain, class 3, transcription factor 1-like [Ipomoea nil]|uniref:POU domain, class 3, transcription factor 1-like n=1 Tax=Ipomoea nil TaxID=35883 RepID=UPI00090125D9|nr:PREDICTED: POU domain, class 3, transcription factor 1-like [Ipomoea nil]